MKRRSILTGLGALLGAAPAGAVASTFARPDIVAAVHHWRRAVAAKNVALAAYDDAAKANTVRRLSPAFARSPGAIGMDGRRGRGDAGAVETAQPARRGSRMSPLRLIKGRWLLWRAVRLKRTADRASDRFVACLVAAERHYGLRPVPGWRVPNMPAR